MAHGDFEDLNRRAAADKVLCDKPFNIAKDPKCDGYQQRLASIVYKLIKKLLVVVLKMRIFLIKNQQKIYTNQLLENLMKEN